MKNVRVIFSPEAEEVYKHLNEVASSSKIESSEVEIVAFILDVIDHKEYDKKFGYN